MFRFTIREMLLLTVSIALGLGWIVERVHSIKLQSDVTHYEREANLSKLAIKTMHEDLDRIERALPPHGLTLVWSRDMRPSVEKLAPAGP